MKFELGEIPELAGYELKNRDWRDGLLLRSPNWLGDACMTIPAIKQLRRLVPPDCGIFVISPPGLTDFYACLECVDVVLPLHSAHKNWSMAEVNKVHCLKPGVALLFNNSPRDPFFLRLAMVPKIFGAAARCRGLMLTRAFKFPRRNSRELSGLHHAAKYLAMAMAIGAPEWTSELPEFKITIDKLTAAPRLAAALEAESLLVVAPGAAYGPAKRWPAENFRQVCLHWLDQGGSVAAVGTVAEEGVVKEVLGSLPKENVFNLAATTNLPELMAVLKSAAACLANDSGVMHLAAVLGIPGIAVFGSTDPSATSPVSKRWELLFERESCAPCFKRVCPKESYRCLRKISASQVVSALENVVA